LTPELVELPLPIHSCSSKRNRESAEVIGSPYDPVRTIWSKTVERSSRINRDLFALLDVFVAAAECGSFSAAAERLRLTRSAVGKAVARLEDRLGTRLLHRNTRRSSLTEQGQVFYEHAARALAEVQAAAATLDNEHHEPRGRVRVTMPVVFGRRCITPALLALARAHPHLDLELSLTDRVVDVIDENVDVALRVGPLVPAAGMAGRVLGGHRMLVCASPDYLARFGRPASLADLASHPCIVYTRDGKLRPWEFAGADGKRIQVAVPSRMRVDDLEVERDAALAGDGLARLPSWLVADDLEQGRLEVALAEDRPFVYEMHAVWQHRRPLPLRVRVVVDAVLAAATPVLHQGR
jgi:DNA-binding transcriptional LysR family regulator